MTDRELLEAAAKAAGVDLSGRYWSDSGYAIIKTPSRDGHAPCEWEVWNPLTDDGDALRLAVKMEVRVTPDPEMARSECYFGPGDADWLAEDWGDDQYAATRRAIVRAAAAMAA